MTCAKPGMPGQCEYPYGAKYTTPYTAALIPERVHYMPAKKYVKGEKDGEKSLPGSFCQAGAPALWKVLPGIREKAAG